MGAFAGVLAGAALFGLALVLGRIRRREMLGGGDVKLLAAIGAFLGWSGALKAVFWAAAFSLIGWSLLGLFDRERVSKSLPFGPYLALGSLAASLSPWPAY